MPDPSRGKNSGGNHVDVPSTATGKPRRSVGANWERRTSTNRRELASATWATIELLPTPGGPQIIAALRTGWATRASRKARNSLGVMMGVRPSCTCKQSQVTERTIRARRLSRTERCSV